MCDYLNFLVRGLLNETQRRMKDLIFLKTFMKPPGGLSRKGNSGMPGKGGRILEPEIEPSGSVVLVRRLPGILHLELNRPEAINSLTLDMVRMVARELETSRNDNGVKLVLLSGRGERGFCAGGDIKIMARAAAENDIQPAMQFLKEENDLDLAVHLYPKPVVVLAHGITMGGGLGIAAGADIVVATESTRMAMPETRIGFFPDVGATGWLFVKCGRGYPEFLGLTGYELKGPQCVGVGLASCLIPTSGLPKAIEAVIAHAPGLANDRHDAADQIREILGPFTKKDILKDPEMDQWVEEYFAGKTSVSGILNGLKECSTHDELCEGVFERLSERSPLAVAITLQCLRRNEGRDLGEVYRSDLKVARYLMEQHDFKEGVRARLIDRDNRPQWDPDTFEKAAVMLRFISFE